MWICLSKEADWENVRGHFCLFLSVLSETKRRISLYDSTAPKKGRPDWGAKAADFGLFFSGEGRKWKKVKKKKAEGFKFTFPHCFMYLRMSLLAWFIRDHLFGWHQRMLKENFNYITTFGANSRFYSRITLLLNEYWVWKYHLYGFWSQTYFWKFLSWGGGWREEETIPDLGSDFPLSEDRSWVSRGAEPTWLYPGESGH